MDEKEIVKMLMEIMKTNIEIYKQREETDRMTLETMRYMDKNHNNSIVKIIFVIGAIIAIFLFCMALLPSK